MRLSDRAPGLVLGDGVVLPDSVELGAHVVIHPGTVLGEGVVVQDGAVLGKPPKLGRRSSAPKAPPPPLEVGAGSAICAGAVVLAGARIAEDVIVGDQAFVRERAVLGPGTVIGRGSAIDNDVTIGARVRVQTLCYLTAWSVVEDDVFFGPGASTTNDDTMGRHGPEYALRGATLRRACRIGGSAVLCPGVEVGEEAFVAAGAVLTRDVPARGGRHGRPRARGARRARRGPARALALSGGGGSADGGAAVREQGAGPAGVGPDRLLAPRADADAGDRHLQEVRDEREVVARGLRQVVLGLRGADVLVPAGELLVLAGRRCAGRTGGRGTRRRPARCRGSACTRRAGPGR